MTVMHSIITITRERNLSNVIRSDLQQYLILFSMFANVFICELQVAEFDSPDRLLLNPNSLFANMLRRSEVKKSNREQSPT